MLDRQVTDYGCCLLISATWPSTALGITSIIVGAAISAVFFKERFGAPRIAAAGLQVVGIGLMLRTGAG